ncbi:MAG: AmmeMemoRadiSam system protein A [Heliobacteriaceae bacterium]|nr:AmmeMemoRadiSam system protein A [Heliobacteriaceae bacterium]MDD4587787.1 AmmeMemoRadiSam system protein A [Heliobacteriaceae bacterium]
MGIVFGGFVPHPPIIVPAVGRKHLAVVTRTVAAMEEWARDCVARQPETLIIISPHGPVFQDVIAVTATERVQGNLGTFGAPQVKADLANDPDLVAAILAEAGKQGVGTGRLDAVLAKDLEVPLALDHGIMVPLSYLLTAGFTGKVVPVAMGFLPRHELFAFGLALRAAMAKAAYPVGLIASGDLSHRLTRDAPSGYAEEGFIFDAQVTRMVKNWDVAGMLKVEETLCEKAGECGFRPLIMLAGAFDDGAVKSKVYSYEGPFGVGYLVAALTPEKPEKPQGEKRLAELRQAVTDQVQAVRENESPIVRFARDTLEAFVQHRQPPAVPLKLGGPDEQPAGVFVSLKKNGQLRGCIGTVAPTQPSLGLEVRYNAVSAGTRDPRFLPVQPVELPEIIYSVDVLGPEEPAPDIAALDPRRYGVIVRAGDRQGLLLPNLEGIETAQEQVTIARRKAGIPDDVPVQLSRFEVVRYH